MYIQNFNKFNGNFVTYYACKSSSFRNYEVAFLCVFTMQKKSVNLKLHTMITCPKLQGLLHDPT
jgi:hypothetical protein